MDYPSCLAYLYDLQHFGIKLGLENTRTLLERLGNPQRKLRIVHVAGTNGKGSTAATLELLLRSTGESTGLYTSPHLHSFTERIRIDGQPVDEAEIVRLTEEVRRAAVGLSPTFFEFTTVMALCHFARCQVDRVVLETGLGGRLDATNVVDPELCIITPVALDHAAHLGDSLGQIAAEKGGIIKPQVPLVIARQQPEAQAVLERLAAEAEAPLYLAGRDFRWVDKGRAFDYSGLRQDFESLESGLLGLFQHENVSVALAAAELLTPGQLQPEIVSPAVNAVRWPGRLEWCGDLLLDGTHNPHAAQALASYLTEEGHGGLIWVVALKSDKEAAGILAPLLPAVSTLLAAPLQTEESKAPAALVELAQAQGVRAEACSTAAEALKRALELKRPQQKVLIAGSLFLIAELRQACLEQAGVVA